MGGQEREGSDSGFDLRVADVQERRQRFAGAAPDVGGHQRVLAPGGDPNLAGACVDELVVCVGAELDPVFAASRRDDDAAWARRVEVLDTVARVGDARVVQSDKGAG